MKKYIITIVLLLTTAAWSLNDGFNFNECSGSDNFEQQIEYYNHNYENAITVGTIPAGIEGLSIELVSDKDVDIRLYGDNDDKIVHWPHGLLSQSTQKSTKYKKTDVTYSGYNGVAGKKGHEFIRVSDTTQIPMTMKAFGYQAGLATVNYHWTGKEGCTNSGGEGNFTQSIAHDTLTLVGDIPAGIPNVSINLTSGNDLDIQLYGKDGTVIVGWKPRGILNGSRVGTIDYKGMNIEWSGYNGTNGNKGNEYIKITGNTTEALTMKVYGYEAGFADVTYSWGEENVTICTTEYKPVCGEGPSSCSTGDLGTICTTDIFTATHSNMCELEKSYHSFLYAGECQLNNFSLHELYIHKQKWQSHNIHDYKFTAEASVTNAIGQVEVLNDAVSSIIGPNGYPQNASYIAKTFIDYFSMIDAILTNPENNSTYNVTYDNTYNFPLFIQTNDINYSISSFSVIDAPMCGTMDYTIDEMDFMKNTDCYTNQTGCEEITYTSMFELEKSNAAYIYWGECSGKSQPCTEEYAPVCGQNFNLPGTPLITYSNECKLQSAGAHFEYTGACQTQAVCPVDYEPVCGISLYHTQQSFMNLTDLLDNNYQLLHNGHCSVQNNVFCTMDCPGVTGINDMCETVTGCNTCTLGTDIILTSE